MGSAHGFQDQRPPRRGGWRGSWLCKSRDKAAQMSSVFSRAELTFKVHPAILEVIVYDIERGFGPADVAVVSV